MQPNIQMNEDLLVKHLLGETSEMEQQQVSKWLNDSAANRKHFEQLKLIWEASKDVEAKSTINVEDAWERFRERTARMESGGAKIIPMPTSRLSWVKAAAIIVVLVGAGFLAYNLGFNNTGKLMAVNSGNSVLIDTLPDGSVVTLNKNSSLSYNSKLDGKIRSVKLEGEAFFNVAPDKEHPFVIDVNGNTVTVVGTSFNIRSNSEKTEVIVETGIVDVAKNENKVRLQPNEKATILLNSEGPVKEDNSDELYNYYKTKEFVCNGTRLSRLVEVLNEAYNTEIVIGNSRLDNLSLNTTFSDASLDYILEVIGKTYNIQVIRNGDKIILQ